MDSEAPLFILYTSGSTGKPKGVKHTTAGYNLFAKKTMEWVFDIRDEDVFWCTADIGWITGHTYIVYGPLTAGATSFMYEGSPDLPAQGPLVGDDREVQDQHPLHGAPRPSAPSSSGATSGSTSTTCPASGCWASVGEGINPRPGCGTTSKIGGGRCPIVDTWWQTETGGIMMTPLPGAIPLKPGSCTKPLPGIIPEVVGEDGKPVTAGNGGWLVITKPWPGMLRGIWGDDERYKIQYWTDVPGKYLCGDNARCDEDGYYWIMGRIDDVLNVSGHRLSTIEIESALVSHPAVAEAAAVGRPARHQGRGRGRVRHAGQRSRAQRGPAQGAEEPRPQGDRRPGRARRHPLHHLAAQDPQRQDHAPAAARHRRRPADRRRHHHAGRLQRAGPAADGRRLAGRQQTKGARSVPRPVLQALVLADHVYKEMFHREDGHCRHVQSAVRCQGKDAGAKKNLLLSKASKLSAQQPSGPRKLKRHEVSRVGSTAAYISLTEVRGTVPLELRDAYLANNRMVLRVEFSVRSGDPLSTVEAITPSPRCSCRTLASFSLLQLLSGDEPVGSHRVMVLCLPGICRGTRDRREEPWTMICSIVVSLAGVLGFEPRLSDPESLVLPLHHTPECINPLPIRRAIARTNHLKGKSDRPGVKGNAGAIDGPAARHLESAWGWRFCQSPRQPNPAHLMAVLQTLQGPKPGLVFALEGNSVTLGRHPECDIVLDAAAVSRQHARILLVDGKYYVEDLNSRNGTLLNGRPLMRRELLREHDQLGICDLVFIFHHGPPDLELPVARRLDEAAEPTAVLIDDEDPPANSSVMSKVDVSRRPSSLRLGGNTEAKLKALLEISQNLGKALALKEVLPKLLDSLFAIFIQADRGFVVLRDPASGRLVPKAVKYRRGDDTGDDPHQPDDRQQRHGRQGGDPFGRRRQRRAFRHVREHRRFSHPLDDVRPLINSEGDAIGVIQIDTMDQRNRFSREDLDVLASVACQAAFAVENAQLHETLLREQSLKRELGVAHEVLRGFLPAASPRLEDYEFFEFYEPANQLGGDYYDYIPLSGGRLAVVVADVSGKGIPASLLMARFSADARYCLASEPDARRGRGPLEPRVLRRRLGGPLRHLGVGRARPARHEITLVNAGHLPPLLRRAAGQNRAGRRGRNPIAPGRR